MSETNPGEVMDLTTPRDSQPVIPDFQGLPDPEAELVVRAQVAAGGEGAGE
jgi:hypothetical protein